MDGARRHLAKYHRGETMSNHTIEQGQQALAHLLNNNSAAAREALADLDSAQLALLEGAAAELRIAAVSAYNGSAGSDESELGNVGTVMDDGVGMLRRALRESGRR
jgi:hypothetical protein